MGRFNVVLLITAVLSFLGAYLVMAQTNAVRRCYQYTWLGHRFNNESVFMNATCQDATRMARGIPCVKPLVVSYDGSWPDVTYIWANHLSDASCVLADNDVCATYTYYFNGQVENSTAMCTRVIDSEGAAITSGCFTERQGSFVTTACFCRSIPGGVPCNSAGYFPSLMPIVTFALSFVFIINRDKYI